VAGPVEVSSSAAERIATALGKSAKLHVGMRIFASHRVVPPTPAPGALRVADEQDTGLILKWLDEFGTECGLRVRMEQHRILSRIKQGFFHLWIDGQPVSLAGATGPTPNGIRIGTVYTPSQFRGRGYASNCVAATTQEFLDGGKKFCVLYTDLANPTSNKIYQQIGYRPVCDWNDYVIE
jgi:predicted GNAT family acetyltransferase